MSFTLDELKLLKEVIDYMKFPKETYEIKCIEAFQKVIKLDEMIKRELNLKEIESSFDHPLCPNCNKNNTHKIYRPEVYEFNSFCKDCDQGFNS